MINLDLMFLSELKPVAKQLKREGLIKGAVTSMNSDQLVQKLTPHKERIEAILNKQKQEKSITRTLPSKRKELVTIAKQMKADGKLKGSITDLTRDELKDKIVKGKRTFRRQTVSGTGGNQSQTSERKQFIDNRLSQGLTPIQLREGAPIIKTPNTVLKDENKDKLVQYRYLFETGHVAILNFDSVNPRLPNFASETEHFPNQYNMEQFFTTFFMKMNEISEDGQKGIVRIIYQYNSAKEGQEPIWRHGSKNIFDKFENVDTLRDRNAVEENIHNKLFNLYGTFYLSGFDILLESITNIQTGGCNIKNNDHFSSCFGWCKYADYRSKKNNCGIVSILKYLKNEGLTEKQHKVNIIRTKLGFEQDVKLTPQELGKVANHFKVNLVIYNFRKEIIYQTETEYEDTCKLLLTFCEEMLNTEKDISLDKIGHYVLVLDDEYFSGKKCPTCLVELPKNSFVRKHHVCNPSIVSYVRGNLSNENESSKFVYVNKKHQATTSNDENSVFVFDFETFVKTSEQELNVYACGVYNKDKGYNLFYGKDTLSDFVKYLSSIYPLVSHCDKNGKEIHKKQFAVAYNGSRFDFYFVFRELLNQGIKVKDYILNNGALLGFTIEHNNLCFWDINQHIGGSLKNALVDFHCKTMKGDFDHFKMKSWEDVDTYKHEWESYLESDVYGLYELQEKYCSVVYNIFSNTEELSHIKFDPKEYLTLPSLGYKFWINSVFNTKDRQNADKFRKDVGQLTKTELQNKLNQYQKDGKYTGRISGVTKSELQELVMKVNENKDSKVPVIQIPNNQKDINEIRFSTYGGKTLPMIKEFQTQEYEKLNILYDLQTEERQRMKEEGLTEDSEEMKRLKELGKEYYQELIKNKDYIFNGDITSLYPTVMRYCEFPNGSLRRLESFPSNKQEELKEEIKTKLNNREELDYFYFLRVKLVNNNRNLVNAPLPKPKYHNNKRIGVSWDIEDVADGWYTNIDIENGIKHGYEVVEIFDLKQYGEGKTKLFDKYVDVFCEIKQHQDYLSSIDSPDYNPALRAVAKIFMNSLYGKTLQKPIYSQTVVCQCSSDIIKFFNSNEVNDCIIEDDMVILSGTKLDLTQGNTKPNHVGAFLLSYSRRIMLNLIEDICPNMDEHVFTYTDTDSAHIYAKHMDILKNKTNPFNGKKWLDTGLGCLSNDIKKDGLIIKELNYAPKSYYYEYINKNGEVLSTKKAKGIPKQYLSDELYKNAESKTITMEKRLKKINIKKTKNQNEQGIKMFSLLQNNFTRTWNPDYKPEQMIEGKWFPLGHTKLNKTINI